MQQVWVPQLQPAPPSAPVPGPPSCPEPPELAAPPEETPYDPSVSVPPSPVLDVVEPPHAAASASETRQSEVLFMERPSLKGSRA